MSKRKQSTRTALLQERHRKLNLNKHLVAKKPPKNMLTLLWLCRNVANKLFWRLGCFITLSLSPSFHPQPSLPPSLFLFFPLLNSPPHHHHLSSSPHRSTIHPSTSFILMAWFPPPFLSCRHHTISVVPSGPFRLCRSRTFLSVKNWSGEAQKEGIER